MRGPARLQMLPDDDLAGGELHDRVERLEGDEPADEPRERRLARPRRTLQRPFLWHRLPGPGHRGDDDCVAPATCGLREAAADGGGGTGAREDGRHAWLVVAFLGNCFWLVVALWPRWSLQGWRHGVLLFRLRLVRGIVSVIERVSAASRALTRG